MKLAEPGAELDALFRLRHRVFCEEMGAAPAMRHRRLRDCFDAMPSVGSFIAVIGGQVVGCVRVVEERGAGLPAHDYFDFAHRLPPSGGARVGSMGMMAIHPAHRRAGLFFMLVGMGHYWAARRSLTHLIGAVAPGAEPLVRSLGYEALAPPRFHEGLGRWAIPVLLDMTQMSPHLAAFVAEQHRAGGPEDFDRTFLRAGEVITRVG